MGTIHPNTWGKYILSKMLLGVPMLCAVKLSCKLSIQVFAYLPLHRSLWVGATTPSTCSIRSLEAAYQTRYSNRPSCRRRIWQKMNSSKCQGHCSWDDSWSEFTYFPWRQFTSNYLKLILTSNLWCTKEATTLPRAFLWKWRKRWIELKQF